MNTTEAASTVEPFDLDKLEAYCNTLRAVRLENLRRIEIIDATLARIQKAGNMPSKSTNSALPHPGERHPR